MDANGMPRDSEEFGAIEIHAAMERMTAEDRRMLAYALARWFDTHEGLMKNAGERALNGVVTDMVERWETANE